MSGTLILRLTNGCGAWHRATQPDGSPCHRVHACQTLKQRTIVTEAWHGDASGGKGGAGGWRLPFFGGAAQTKPIDEFESDEFETETYSNAGAEPGDQVITLTEQPASVIVAVSAPQERTTDLSAVPASVPAPTATLGPPHRHDAAWLRQQLYECHPAVVAAAGWAAEPGIQHLFDSDHRSASNLVYEQPEIPPAVITQGAAQASQNQMASAGGPSVPLGAVLQAAQPLGQATHSADMSLPPGSTSAIDLPPQAGTSAIMTTSQDRTQRLQASPSLLPTASAAGMPADLMYSSAGGWAMAFTILFAIRLSREQSDLDRLDLRTLQLRQQESRVQSRELREKRRQYLEGERLRKEAEAARRVEVAQKRARDAEVERLAREAAYEAEQAIATTRVMEQQAAARRAYEERQQQMATELARRTEAEMRLREERERRRQEEEETRRAQEAARAAAEAERQRLVREEERRRQDAEVARVAEEAKRRRELLATYTLRFSGSATVQMAGPGGARSAASPGSTSGSGGRLQVQLTARLDGCSSSTGSGAAPVAALHPFKPMPKPVQLSGSYGSADMALEGGTELAGKLSAQVLTSLTDELLGSGDLGGLSPIMDEIEVRHWARLTQVQLAASLRQAVAQVAPLAGASPLEQPVQLDARWIALPQGHAGRADVRLCKAAGHLAAMDRAAAAQLVTEVISEEEDVVMRACPLVPPLVVATCVHSQLLARCATAQAQGGAVSKAAGGATATVTSEGRGRTAALEFAEQQLTLLAQSVPLDSLTASAWAVAAVLGQHDELAKHLAKLAQQNMSPTSRRALEVRQQQERLSAAAAALTSSPHSTRFDRAIPQSRARPPVAEQLWALRNVANKMVAMAVPGQINEGMALLAQAAQLASDAYGEGHPGQLSTLMDYRDALNSAAALAESEPEAAELAGRATAVTHEILRIVQEVAERYVQQQEHLSAALLLESALREMAVGLPSDDADVVMVQSRLQLLCNELSPAETRQIMGQSQQSQAAVGSESPQLRSPPSRMRQLARDFTEQLGVYSGSRRSSNKFDLWVKGFPLPPLR